MSTTESFSRVIESVRTNNTSWAPALTSPVYREGGPLYWRVATVDEGNNVGAYVGGRVGRQAAVGRVSGRLRRNATSGLTVRSAARARR